MTKERAAVTTHNTTQHTHTHLTLTSALWCSAGASRIHRHDISQNLNITQSHNAIYGIIIRTLRTVDSSPHSLPHSVPLPWLSCSHYALHLFPVGFFFSIRCPIFLHPTGLGVLRPWDVSISSALHCSSRSVTGKPSYRQREQLRGQDTRLLCQSDLINESKKPSTTGKSQRVAIFHVAGFVFPSVLLWMTIEENTLGNNTPAALRYIFFFF